MDEKEIKFNASCKLLKRVFIVFAIFTVIGAVVGFKQMWSEGFIPAVLFAIIGGLFIGVFFGGFLSSLVIGKSKADEFNLFGPTLWDERRGYWRDGPVEGTILNDALALGIGTIYGFIKIVKALFFYLSNKKYYKNKK